MAAGAFRAGNEGVPRGRERLRLLRAVADRQRREAEVLQKDAFLSRVSNRS